MHADSDDDYGYDDYDGNGGEDYFAVRGVVFLQCAIGLRYTASAGEMYRVPSAPFELQTG